MSFRIEEANTKEQLECVRKLYEESFPKSEKKPFSMILKKRAEGFFDILAIENEEGQFCGLAIMLLAGGLALLDYLAIAPEYQGGGAGSSTLRELRERYGRGSLVVEIETTLGEEAAQAENAEERLRRKRFYLRNGMKTMDFVVNLFGVEMEILTFGRTVTFEEYYGIYEAVLPKRMMDKIRLA
jgi:GNAT superfamily N-acetyltransferase|nr:GNAT family N-acetyltransferase [uncultured Acetatifactor sp.]